MIHVLVVAAKNLKSAVHNVKKQLELSIQAAFL